MVYGPQDRKESDMTEWLTVSHKGSSPASSFVANLDNL